ISPWAIRLFLICSLTNSAKLMLFNTSLSLWLLEETNFSQISLLTVICWLVKEVRYSWYSSAMAGYSVKKFSQALTGIANLITIFFQALTRLFSLILELGY